MTMIILETIGMGLCWLAGCAVLYYLIVRPLMRSQGHHDYDE